MWGCDEIAWTGFDRRVLERQEEEERQREDRRERKRERRVLPCLPVHLFISIGCPAVMPFQLQFWSLMAGCGQLPS